ncbi:MAG: hypothetical protein AAF614_10895 [Chloroflexota bacterium]
MKINLFIFLVFVLTSCQPAETAVLPTIAVAINATDEPATIESESESSLPPTFTPEGATPLPTLAIDQDKTEIESTTVSGGDIPTHTPIPPTPTNTATPTNTPTATPFHTPRPIIKPIHQYTPDEIIPYQAFPVPTNNNGWGMHWIPTNAQHPGVVDQFVAELVKMNIKWVVFLNDGTQVGDNDYLVDQLVAHNIMPVMRLFQSTVEPYSGDIGGLVHHYRARGVYYYQLYNEPNIDVENTQGFSDPNRYAAVWATAAREVIANGGLPGIGALSPGGEYDHYEFLDRTLRVLAFNGDADLLNHAWLSIHNYHGTRAFDDPGGFLLFREYDSIIQSHLGRSLPMVGTEAGSYAPENRALETELIRWQYDYMANAEPYYLAFSYWLLANKAGGGNDDAWEWQALFKPGFVHPTVTEYFYQRNE